jgi:hypothetical protein
MVRHTKVIIFIVNVGVGGDGITFTDYQPHIKPIRIGYGVVEDVGGVQSVFKVSQIQQITIRRNLLLLGDGGVQGLVVRV